MHDAYLRLQKRGAPKFENRAHFLAVCAQLMRQILVDYARSHRAAKRDGGDRVTLDGMALRAGLWMWSLSTTPSRIWLDLTRNRAALWS